MKQRSTQAPSPDIEYQIREWIENNPDNSEAGRRMLVQLQRIRNEFTGATAQRLEALVCETLERQIQIDESRKTGLAAAETLSESVRRLGETMAQCLQSARKAHSAITRSANALNTRKRATETYTFLTPARHSDKMRMN